MNKEFLETATCIISSSVRVCSRLEPRTASRHLLSFSAAGRGLGADGAHTQSMSVDVESGKPPATTTHVSLIAAAAGLPRAAGRGVVTHGVAADAR